MFCAQSSHLLPSNVLLHTCAHTKGLPYHSPGLAPYFKVQTRSYLLQSYHQLSLRLCYLQLTRLASRLVASPVL